MSTNPVCVNSSGQSYPILDEIVPKIIIDCVSICNDKLITQDARIVGAYKNYTLSPNTKCVVWNNKWVPANTIFDPNCMPYLRIPYNCRTEYHIVPAGLIIIDNAISTTETYVKFYPDLHIDIGNDPERLELIYRNNDYLAIK